MDKINFENLPSTNTPLDADALNEMQDNIEESVVAIGETQPSTSENVWIKKGKNLFNKNAVLKNYELTNNGANVGYNALWFVSDYIEVRPNTTYYLSGNKTGGTTNAFYDENKTFISYVSKTTGDITTPSNAKYMRFNGRQTEIDNNIMFEQNSTSTTYEPYVEKEILVKNNNGVFEEFYNEGNFIELKENVENNTNNISELSNKFSSCAFYYNRLGGNSTANINLTSCVIFATKNGNSAFYMVDTWGNISKIVDATSIINVTATGSTFNLNVSIRNNLSSAIELFIIKNIVQH